MKSLLTIGILFAFFMFTHGQLYSYQLTINLQQNRLPLSLQWLLRMHKINSLAIHMGHWTKTDRWTCDNKIKVFIYNQTKLQEGALQQISSAFAFSSSKKHHLYLQQLGAVLIADPNDRLCTQQIQWLLNSILLCRNYSQMKLGFLLNIQKLLRDGISIDLTLNKQTNIMKIRFVLQCQKNCQTLQLQTACGLLKVVPFKEQRVNVRYDALAVGNWYGVQKSITHIFDFQQKNNDLTPVVVLTGFPRGFKLTSIEFQPKNASIRLEKIQMQGTVFVKMIINVHKLQKVKVKQIFKAQLIGFQHYQTIAGGGQELLNIALINTSPPYILPNKQLLARLLQPDFSLPFQTIVFTVGIVGYLWISLWRLHRIK